MRDVVIRGLSDAAVARIEAEATALGPSRNEFLRRLLEKEASMGVATTVTADDWKRSAQVFSDLSDGDVMDAAWR